MVSIYILLAIWPFSAAGLEAPKIEIVNIANNKGDTPFLLTLREDMGYESFIKYDLIDLVSLSLSSGSVANFSYGEKYSSTIDNFIKAYQENRQEQDRYYFILKMLFDNGANNFTKKDVVLLKSIKDCDDKLISLLLINKGPFTQTQLQKALEEAGNKLSYLKTENSNEKDIVSKIESTNKIIVMLEKAVAESVHKN